MIIEECQDCDWSDEWSGGSASDDPALVHLTFYPDHTVSGRVE